MRIEPQQIPEKSRAPFKAVGKSIWFLIKLPFRISLRVLFVLVVLLALVLIAETGIWDVPYLSKLIYRQPQPTRYITTTPYSAALLSLAVDNAQAVADPSKQVSITEGQLTALVQEANRSQDKNPFSSVQTVITPKSIELFGNLSSRPSVFVTINLLPEVVSQKVSLQIKQIRIGHVPLPQRLFHSSLISYITGTLAGRMFSHISVDSVSLQDRALILHAQPQL